jgi:osmotically-inducible protein OsmY
MSGMRLAVVVLMLALAGPALTGCAAALVGGAVVAASAIHDRRTSGAIVEDNKLELKIRDRLHQDDGPGKDNHIKTISHNMTVLLIGEVATEADRDAAEKIASAIPSVRRVVNEIEVMPNSGLSRRSRDLLLTSQVKTALIGLDIKGFDPSRINVTSARGNVYLMGLVTQQEGEAAAQRVRTVRGVMKVVKVFEYTDTAD